MKKDYDVVKAAQDVIDEYIKRLQNPPKPKRSVTFPIQTGTKKPLRTIPVYPIAALAFVCAALCAANIALWFSC